LVNDYDIIAMNGERILTLFALPLRPLGYTCSLIDNPIDIAIKFM
jgi:hypothetical protein